SMRRSIVAKHDLLKGTILSRDDITWIRPAGGLPPGHEHIVIGKELTIPLSVGKPILPEHLKDNRIR
ncbi:unnamed protein product, partial [marine sediment metagenome]